MENKQTSIEWLKDNLEQYGSCSRLDLDWETFDELIEQAKAMEKEQIINAYNNGEDRSAELYYKETYMK
jgi:predicted Zn-dependent peptidase